MEWSVEGKQLSEKYYYDCTSAILQSFNISNDSEACYQYTKKIVKISRLLFLNWLMNYIKMDLQTEWK